MLFDQSPYDCRVEWGRRGTREAAARGDIIIVVDVLSFSSTVVSAAAVGAEIFPFPPGQDGREYAKSVGADYIFGRAEAAKLGKPTLSPVSFSEEHAGKKYVLISQNGAYCTWIGAKATAVLAGSLLNASAAAAAANILQQLGAGITIIPCGEKWADAGEHEDSLRPAVEDYLGAGAILSYLDGEKSPEAAVCEGAFQAAQPKLAEYLWECGSGRELRARGFEQDVVHCSRLDAMDTVPVLRGDHFVSLPQTGYIKQNGTGSWNFRPL
ncbi:2-phosphosulfolactate phosphatase [Bacillus infantis]|uniref:2-phosphosulfolactate phosphatase n=1 Tax=Bacillus infantis TaxID=324767 RepID=UPI00101C7973|nr:2-phosphosulfolactate phosphatase [Bacillus infantis]RYI26622.1 2-phosphosulfolactate phosphatase [Bacillus infantis]